jgi:hypothetical protein
MYSIYDCLGQPSFSFRIPSAPLQPRFGFKDEALYPQAQSTRFQAPVTTDSVMVVASINGVERQRGRVLQSQVNDARRILTIASRFLPVDEALSAQLLLQIEVRPRPGTFGFETLQGRYTYDLINQVLKVLGFRPIEFVKGYELWPDRLRRTAQVRSRGGFATLFGVGVGYALGGMPGAMVGAAISRVL